MFDFVQTHSNPNLKVSGPVFINVRDRLGFRTAKRVFDVAVSLMLMPVLVIAALVLLLVNPFYNRGSLIFRQQRMGQHCQPFTAYKFRSMRDIGDIQRGANDPLEHDRITKLGHIIRKTRIDELPQLINVLKGEMSLIGPRPDYYPHALQFLDSVPGYRARHSVRPGISGLAQTEVGYVMGAEETRRKVLADLFYIRNSGYQLEAWVFYRTVAVVLGRAGS